MSQSQSLGTATRKAKGLHGHLYALVDCSDRNDDPRHDDAFDGTAEVESLLSGVEREPEIAVLKVFGLGQSRDVNVSDHCRLYQREIHGKPLCKGTLAPLTGHIASRHFVMHRTHRDHGVHMVKGAAA